MHNRNQRKGKSAVAPPPHPPQKKKRRFEKIIVFSEVLGRKPEISWNYLWTFLQPVRLPLSNRENGEAIFEDNASFNLTFLSTCPWDKHYINFGCPKP